MDNKTKVDRLHEILPQYLNTKGNVNWSGLLEAVGQQDELLSQLISEVRKQFFVKTASRPYLDVLAANNNVARPRLVGMSDTSFRDYIPVLSYQPKQVKLIIDSLLDIFFFKESTTAFIMSAAFEPFYLEDGWELALKIDGIYEEGIIFRSSDFTDVSQATTDEIIASYNRQAKYSYATNFYDSITQHSYVRIFTKTVGAKGSIEIVGGRANITLRLNGFIDTAGNGSNTRWTVSKIGDTVTFQHTGGTSPGINRLQIGDIFICNLFGNEGSFAITNINVSESKIQFVNLFATAGVFTQTSALDTKFVRPEKYVVYKVARRAITWETTPGEITIETPTTPPVVQRSLRGSWHVNGVFSLMTNRDSNTSLTVSDAAGFPKSGVFIIEPVETITSRIVTPDLNEVVVTPINGRVISNFQRYTYASRVAVTTTGTMEAGSNQIIVASSAGLSNGMTVFIPGLRQDAVITNIAGIIVTCSVVATTSYSGVVEFGGNTLYGVSPSLPITGSLNEHALLMVSRSSNEVICTTDGNHGFEVGNVAFLHGSSGIQIVDTTGDLNETDVIANILNLSNVSPGQLVLGAGIPSNTYVTELLSATSVRISKDATISAVGSSIQFSENLNNGYTITSIPASNQFVFVALGSDGSAVVPGNAVVEKIGLSNANSKIILSTAQKASDTRITGAYVWDKSAPFVLSSATATSNDEINAGKIVRLLSVSDNNIPNQSGFIIIDYGKESQEGPIKYLYKPADNVLALDPSYIFTKDHGVNATVVTLSHKGPHVLLGSAAEYAPYITDPSEARVILEQLIKSVASAGIFVNFLVRYPTQLYGTLDTYNSGQPPEY